MTWVTARKNNPPQEQHLETCLNKTSRLSIYHIPKKASHRLWPGDTNLHAISGPIFNESESGSELAKIHWLLLPSYLALRSSTPPLVRFELVECASFKSNSIMRVEIQHSPDQLGSLHFFTRKNPGKNASELPSFPLPDRWKSTVKGVSSAPFDRCTLFAFCSVSYSAQIVDISSIVFSKLRSDPDQYFCRSPLSWGANNDQSWAQPVVFIWKHPVESTRKL